MLSKRVMRGPLVGALREMKLTNRLGIMNLGRKCFSTRKDPSFEMLGMVARNVIAQQGLILEAISDEDYLTHHAFYLGSSVGGHVRHTLDHWAKLLNHDFTLGADEPIDYDSRERYTETELNRLIALSANDKILHGLNTALQSRQPNTPVKVMFLGDSKTGERYTVESTFARELSFVSHHATHHLSTIKLLMQTMSYTLPREIGMATSTIQYLDAIKK
jgi:uncharacterized damage-inducible protein DinB